MLNEVGVDDRIKATAELFSICQKRSWLPRRAYRNEYILLFRWSYMSLSDLYQPVIDMAI